MYLVTFINNNSCYLQFEQSRRFGVIVAKFWDPYIFPLVSVCPSILSILKGRLQLKTNLNETWHFFFYIHLQLKTQRETTQLVFSD